MTNHHVASRTDRKVNDSLDHKHTEEGRDYNIFAPFFTPLRITEIFRTAPVSARQANRQAKSP